MRQTLVALTLTAALLAGRHMLLSDAGPGVDPDGQTVPDAGAGVDPNGYPEGS